MIVPAASNPPPHIASLETLKALIAEDMAAVNRVILEKVSSDASLITDLATYIVSSGGKRIRPSLTVACARLCGYEGERHVNLAACVEFIHTATLLHDDVVDMSVLRRGKPTANEVWSNQSSVLVGDFLFSRAFQLMVADGAIDVLKILSDAAATISEGEVKQMMTAHSPDIEETTYMEVIEGKTAALFAAACTIGAIITGQPESVSQALHRFGRSLGIAFQLVDDALDYSASEEALGKTIGDDFREGKVTLPLLLAYQRADETDRGFLRAVFDDEQTADPESLTKARQVIEKHDTLNATLDRAAKHAQTARDALQCFDDGPIKSALLEAVDFCIHRAY